MEKYYTPDISEFCFGFEYEALREDVWEKYTFPHPFGYCYAEGQEPYLVEFFVDGLKEDVRVKCLDRQDVEDLEWEWSKYCFKMVDKNPNHIIELRLLDNGMVHICKNLGTNERSFNSVDYDTLFEGIIKNRSELRRVMQQLNIA